MKLANKNSGNTLFFEILNKRREDFIMRVREYISKEGIEVRESSNKWKCDFWIPRECVSKLYPCDKKGVSQFLEHTEDHFWIPVSIKYKTIRKKDTLVGNLPKIIIGRRYSLGRDTSIRHCFQRLVYTIERRDRPLQIKKRIKKNFLNLDYPFDSSKKRQLKMALRKQMNLKTICGIYQKCIFVDFETITDFQDNLSEFPVAQDTSMIFMIGAGTFDKNGLWQFTSFTANSLEQDQEREIVSNFYKYLLDKKSLGYKYLVHWSHAEQVQLRKVNQKWKEFNNLTIDLEFLDLMKPFKDAYPTQSVSLKRIAKSWKAQNLIKTDYDNNKGSDNDDSDNDNIVDGLTAMASIVSNWNEEVVQKILDYNHKDTLVLAEILKKIS